MLAPNTNTLARVALTLLTAGGVISTLVWAGPLNPPSGAVSSTYKTLTEVEPRIAINSSNTPGDADSLYKITQPGSYYLTGNITGVVGKHGIEIAASGVTLDLNGFELIGVASMGNVDGVTVTTSGLTNIAVLNGSIRNWGQDGIDFITTPTAGCRIQGIVVTGCAGVSFYLGTRSEISQCVSRGGLTGYYTGMANTVRDCVADAAIQTGMFIGAGSTVSNCVAVGNADGFYLSGANASNCTSYLNSGCGFVALGGSAITNCIARANSLDGIKCATECRITDNSCLFNGSNSGDGAGIHAYGADNRIESNVCTSADRGIDVDVAGNIIVRNTCSGNTTNWDVVAGNACLVVSATTGGAILGNSGGASLGSTDPNANFTY
ncbi:MAG: hypothetical protein IT432_01490 [Phycisphaerales bacterium]|nr:hypothetical protein [Phycisphaerales bacterium]